MNKGIQAMAANNLRMRLFMLTKLPMAFFAGLRVVELNEEKCTISIPFKWLNKNPFRSIYFACLSMAAEMSTGLPAFSYLRSSKIAVSMLVIKSDAEFFKKANEKIFFTCTEVNKIMATIENAKQSTDAQLFKATSIGKTKDGIEVARLSFTWSFKSK